MTAPDQSALRDTSREEVITREFDASRERVWRALTEPKLFGQWWAPRGMSADIKVLDVRAGGAYEVAMIVPDGTRYPITGRYLEVVAPDRVVCTQDVDGHPKEWHEQLRALGGDALGRPLTLTIGLEALGANRTRLTATTRFETEALREAFTKLGMHAGWNSQLDKLEDLTVDTTGRELSTSREEAGHFAYWQASVMPRSQAFFASALASVARPR